MTGGPEKDREARRGEEKGQGAVQGDKELQLRPPLLASAREAARR